jgi:hypothetical protein
MGIVSQAITEAKSMMPETSETEQAKSDLAKAHKTIAAATAPSARHDPDARKLAQTAQSDATAAEQRIERIRGEAIQQLRKLAQTYEYSAQQVNSVTPPTFSPPAKHMASKGWFDDPHNIYVDSGASPKAVGVTAGGRGTGADESTFRGNGQHVTGLGYHTSAPHDAAKYASADVPTSRPVDMEIDAVDTLPRASAASTSGPATPYPRLPHHEPFSPAQPLLPPVTNDGSSLPTGFPSARVSSPTQLPTGGSMTGPTPRVPREFGIVGGRPVFSGSGQTHNSIGRGTVIGKEGVQGRTIMPRGMAAQGPAAGGTSTSKGMPIGRRLASEPGGVAGSRQLPRGRSGGRPFTPGGTGLVRPSTNSTEPTRGSTTKAAHTSAAAQSRSSREDREKGQRPDYLVEDEETWVRDDRRPVPPVVE